MVLGLCIFLFQYKKKTFCTGGSNIVDRGLIFWPTKDIIVIIMLYFVFLLLYIFLHKGVFSLHKMLFDGLVQE